MFFRSLLQSNLRFKALQVVQTSFAITTPISPKLLHFSTLKAPVSDYFRQCTCYQPFFQLPSLLYTFHFTLFGVIIFIIINRKYCVLLHETIDWISRQNKNQNT